MTVVLLILAGWILISGLTALVLLARGRTPRVPPAHPSRVQSALDDTGEQVDATVFPIRRTVRPPDRPAA